MSTSMPPGYPPPGTPPPPAYGRAPIYPLVTTLDESVTMSRLWGIPLLGVMARGLLAIPHFIILWFFGIGVGLAWLVLWIPVLLNGRFPAWGYTIVGGYLRWQTRVTAYTYLMSAAYPPFGLEERYEVDVRWDPDQVVPRWAGIPLFGVLVRVILLVPHFIVLAFLGIAAGLFALFAWAPVLVNGRQAHIVYQLVGGLLRWTNRVTAYLMLMTGPYPPFSLED